MSKKQKHSRRRHPTPRVTKQETTPPNTSALKPNDRAVAGELMGALLGAITFGALQE